MARGEHPQRTPAYGAGLIVAAMIAATLVTYLASPTPLRVVVYVVGFVAALIGLAMTLRDNS